MAASPNFEEGQSTYRPPRFNGQYYDWWKTRMHDFIMADNSELWDVICDSPHVPMKKLGETGPMVPKDRKEYSDVDKKTVEKNYRSKKILVKQSKIDMLTTEYELFRMKDDESIQDMHTILTSIINEFHSLGDVIPRNKLVRKILSVLGGSWESKVNAITKAKDLQTLTMDELIGNLKTYEMKIKKDSERREPKKEKNLLLKVENSDSSEEDSDMPILLKDFKRWFEEMVVYIKEAVQEQYKQNPDKATKRNPVPDKRFSRKRVADNIVKQALAAWSDDDEEDENDEVNFRDVQRNLKSYSSKKLRSLANVLIAAYYNLINDKEILTLELGYTEESRDDLMFCVLDLNKTIANPEKEKEVLNKKINSVENERDNLMVVVVDLKETIEVFSNEKHTLEKKNAATEQEKDDSLVIITDLEETIEKLKSELRPASIEKGKEVASESHIKLEKELNDVKTSLCGELEKNR
ncbi:uncharacterized protein [Nicotiana sylvestris]|uniref:uncharacterized protein n=1 Tax=Nicotiana sylvestris TaxID=4096 RepID=UPI00388C4304